MSTPTPETFEALRVLQKACHTNAVNKGFHDAERLVHNQIVLAEGDVELTKVLQDSLIDRAGNRLMLIVGEASEAHEEIRSGIPANLTYYTCKECGDTSFDPDNLDPERNEEYALTVWAPGGVHCQSRVKPEGVPSEIADIVIRCLDFAGEHDIDLASIIETKMGFNATRPAMHGKKF